MGRHNLLPIVSGSLSGSIKLVDGIVTSLTANMVVEVRVGAMVSSKKVFTVTVSPS